MRREHAGQIVAPGLNRGLDLGCEIAQIAFVLRFFLLEQRHISFDHGDAFIHPRNLVVHVANILLKDDFGILGEGNE